MENKINQVQIAETIAAQKCPTCGTLFTPALRCPNCGQKVVSRTKMELLMKERVQMVRAMETVCRNINDEEVFMGWLMCGVADGDIDKETTDEFLQEAYCKDDDGFAELMDCFLRCMNRAYKSGGLFCGDVVSNVGKEVEN